MNLFAGCILSAAALLAPVFCAAAGEPLEIWFDTPCSAAGSEVWNLPASGTVNPDPEWESSSLPLGNGSVGANVMGAVSVERITLNEKTLWHGGPAVSDDASYYWDVNRTARRVLGKIRRAFSEGNQREADSLTRKYFTGKASYEKGAESPFRFGSFTTMGEIRISTEADPERMSGYRRSLSLDSAVASVSFDCDSVRHVRKFFISYPDNVMVMRFTSGRKQRLVLEYSSNPGAECRVSGDGTPVLAFSGRLMDNGMEFSLGIMALTDGGTARPENGKLIVEGSDDTVFILSADTGYSMNYDPDFADPHAYYGETPETNVRKWLSEAAEKGYDELLARHLDDYTEMFGRVDLDLGPGLPHLPAPARLAAYRAGNSDPGLEALFFQFGRYLLISSSREGSMPANLQGIWHNGTDGPWHVDYHNNINLQMNYWPALSTALEECRYR